MCMKCVEKGLLQVSDLETREGMIVHTEDIILRAINADANDKPDLQVVVNTLMKITSKLCIIRNMDPLNFFEILLSHLKNERDAYYAHKNQDKEQPVHIDNPHPSSKH